MDKKEIKTEELINQMEADYQYYSQELKTLRDIISNKEKRNAALFLEAGRYRKALEEIEEIVKSLNENRMCFYDDINDCSNCDMNTDCNYLRKSKILNIIDKAKGEGNALYQ